METVISVNNVVKKYGETSALAGVSFSLPEKGFIFVTGVSGSGKTTLLNLMAGLARPTSGEVLYEGKNLLNLSESELSAYRNVDVGVVFQSYNLVENMTVEENLRLTLLLQDADRKKINERIREVLTYVGLEKYSDHKGYELSAGQRQRVAIARAILKKPKVVFADEATGNLDEKTSEQILELFLRISKQVLVILVSHDRYAAKRYADRILTLSEGKLIEDVDNTLVKETYCKNYHLTYSFGNKMFEKPLSEFDMVSVVAQEMDAGGRKCHFEADIYPQEALKDEIFYDAVPMDAVHPIRLKFRDIAMMYNKRTKQSLLRNMALLFLLTFIVYLMFLVRTLAVNDYALALAEYVKNDDETVYAIELKARLKDGRDLHLRQGEIFAGLLRETFGDDEILKEIPFSTLLQGTRMIDVAAYEYNSGLFEDTTISGNWPSAWNEIAVSASAAKTYDLEVGTVINTYYESLRIVGLYEAKWLPNEESIILSPKYLSFHMKNDADLRIEGADILSAFNVSRFASGNAALGSVLLLSEQDLIWGRMPQKDNELVVSKAYLESHDYDVNDSFPENLRLPDLYSDEYENRFSEQLNLYDHIGKNVSIVGVYDFPEELQEYRGQPDILLSEKVYDEVCKYIGEYLYCSNVMVVFKSAPYEAISRMFQRDIRFTNQEISFVYVLSDEADSLGKIIWIVEAVALGMVLLITLLGVSFSVRDDAKNIGIYKALGVRTADLTRLYLIHGMSTGIISLMIANPLVWITIKGINSWLESRGVKEFFTIYHVNLPNMIFLNTLVLVLILLLTYIPLRLLLRRETIRLLNEG
ncbi:MAG: ABC transporter ATP-binding protein/permease [Lachnospiraceae bacterium]|nr:ABC transporter ATP-binding protein/permease [Lachnospiraceae bacterium]